MVLSNVLDYEAQSQDRGKDGSEAVEAGRGRALASCPRYKETTKCRGKHMEGASLGALCTHWLVARSRGTDSLIAVRIFGPSLSLSMFCSSFLLCFVRLRRLTSPSVVFAELVIIGRKCIRKQTTQLPSVICLELFFRTPVRRPQKGPTPPRLTPDTAWLECVGRAATRRSGILRLQGVITNGTWRLRRSGVRRRRSLVATTEMCPGELLGPRRIGL